jgi:SAM-dependent methyltransferase
MSRLRPEQDAVGQSYLAYLKDHDVQHVVERDDGLVEPCPLHVYFTRYDNWTTWVRQAMKYVRGRVLDIGCGAGRHALYLQKKGLDVLGTDASPLAIRVCRRQGLKHTAVLGIDELTPRLGRFDTFLMLGNNFGLFAGRVPARRRLRRLQRIAADGARIVAEVLNPYGTRNPVHLAYQERNRRRGRMSGQIRLRVRYWSFATPWFDYLFVSVPEMDEIIQGTGWRRTGIIHAQGPSYIAILEKE